MNYLLTASLIWAFSFGLIKGNLTSLDPNFVTFCRMAFALPLFLPFLKLKKISIPDAFQLAIIGAIQYGAMYLCFTRSFQYLDAHQAALFTTLTPLYIIIINDLFSKKFTPFYFMTAALSVIGGSIIYYQYSGTRSILTGFFLVQMADICFAFGQIAYKRFRQTHQEVKDLDVYALLFIGAVITAAVSTTWFKGWSSIGQVSTQQFFILLYLGSIASGICFFWWNKGAVTIHPGILAVLNNLKGPLAIVISVLFFKEHPDFLRLFLGLSLIMLALFLAERHSKNKVFQTRSPLKVH